MHPEISVLSFISVALVLVPVTWYLEARNIAAFAIGIWLSITNLIYAIDSLVWAQDIDIKVPVWCDISSSFITGSRIALPAACLCICFHLERLASFSPTPTHVAKRRRILFECIMCFGLPVVYTALHLIVQPRRFDLIYGFGCRPATFPSVATVFLVLIPPILLALGTICFAVLAWRHFVIHGVQFSGRRSSTSSHTRNMYVCLIGMALMEAILSIPITSVAMWPVLSAGLVPITDMSRDLSLITVWSQDAIPNSLRAALEIEWAATVVQSMLFFGLFVSRMEVPPAVSQAIWSVREFFRKRNANTGFGHVSSTHSSSGTSALTVPPAMIDLALAPSMRSATTITHDEHSIAKSFPPTSTSSRPSSLIEAISEELGIHLDSPGRTSVIPSSHNSLESNFDPRELVLPHDWLQPPPSTAAHAGRRRSSSLGCTTDIEASLRAPSLHARSRTSDVCATTISSASRDTPEVIYVAVPNRTF